MNGIYIKWPLGIMLMVCLLIPTSAISGNRHMIESQVERLKRLNEEAIKQVPNLPASGRVHLKAEIQPGPAPQQIVVRKIEVKPFHKGLKASLRAYSSEGPAMVALTPPQIEPGHRSFKEGIRRYIEKLN